MLYFCYSNNEICKYEIKFNSEKVKELRRNIISSCSTITHVEKDSFEEPVDEEKDNIKNFRCRKEELVYTINGVDVYTTKCVYSYDIVEYPYLVDLIDKLLKDENGAIDEILAYDCSLIDNDLLYIAYDELLGMIEFIYIGAININDVDKVTSFFEIEYNDLHKNMVRKLERK